MNLEFIRKLPIPAEIKKLYPQTSNMAEVKSKIDMELCKIFSGKSDRLVLIIGPCSADYENSILEYVSRLKKLQEQVKDKLLLIPRVYTGKPRTHSNSYKGMLHQPNPTQKPDMLKGIIAIRKLHMKIAKKFDMATADEILYPENYRYLSDLLSYATVGARSIENQEHRLIASGVTIPVGMKNPISGNLSVMLDAISTAQCQHTFIYRGWEIQSHGNPFVHAILRGYLDKYGHYIPNYHYEDLELLCEIYEQRNLKNPAVIIDTNHANSGKLYNEQIRICKEILYNRKLNKRIHKLVKGFMIESYLESGNQSVDGNVFGKSITDPCIGWDDTEQLIFDIANFC